MMNVINLGPDVPPMLQAFLQSLSGLSGPRIGFGACLAPKYPSGTLFWTDPKRTPQHGDLISYHWPEAHCTHLRETYGITANGGNKYYRVKNGVAYLESNEGIALLTPEWIIDGVVVGTFTFRHPPPELAALIARTDADIAVAERKMDATGAITPLDGRGATRRKGTRA